MSLRAATLQKFCNIDCTQMEFGHDIEDDDLSFLSERTFSDITGIQKVYPGCVCAKMSSVIAYFVRGLRTEIVFMSLSYSCIRVIIIDMIFKSAFISK